jgi:hypothetical protein
LIEVTVTKICFGVGSKLELTAPLGGRGIDACRSQALQMIVLLPWIYHVDGLIATRKPVLYEWKQHAVLFVVAVEKRTDVTYVAELGAGKGNWGHGVLHGVYLALLSIASETDNPCLFRTLVAAAKAPSLDSLMNSMHLSKPNVYKTLVLPGGMHTRSWPQLAINDTPSEETSIDTFVQLVSPHFSGLIAIVRSQEARLSGFKNREQR